MNIKTKILLLIACVAIILGIVFCIIGFDKKNNYYSSENFYSLNVNAYVGGDAYNYIINGTYFAGYLALAGALFTCGCICGVGGLLFEKGGISEQAENHDSTEPLIDNSNIQQNINADNLGKAVEEAPTDDANQNTVNGENVL